MSGVPSGLHDSPLAYWSRLGCAHPLAAGWPFSVVADGATGGARACQPACRRPRSPRVCSLPRRRLFSPRILAAPANIAGMIVFPRPRPQRLERPRLDQQAGDDRPRRHEGLPGQRHLHRRRLSRAHLHLGYHPAASARRWTALGVRIRDCRAATTPVSAPASTSARTWQRRCSPNAIVSIHGDGGPPTGRGFHVLYSSPPLNAAQSGPSVQFAQVMRDQLAASGFVPSTYIGSSGLDPRSDHRGSQPRAIPVDPCRMRQHEEPRRLRTDEDP